ncbi:hypothetical protein Ancab_027880 [Ancistrocladus abbreviatus]
MVLPVTTHGSKVALYQQKAWRTSSSSPGVELMLHRPLREGSPALCVCEREKLNLFFSDMEECSMDKGSLFARVQQLEHERNELRKDIEQLCIQQAGPSYLVYATRMHFQRTAGLEQEIENLKTKLAACTRDSLKLKEELSVAYRIKSQQSELYNAEVSKNLEAEKQLKFFHGCVASAFAERDHALMEAEKAKEKAETMSQNLEDCQKRLEELTSDACRTQDLLTRLQTDLEKQDTELEIFKKVISKFYEIRQLTSVDFKDEYSSWDLKCAWLLDDPAEAWSFIAHREDSTVNYISALQEEVETLRSSVDNLQNKLRVGLEIENHLKRRIRKLEHKRIIADDVIMSGISRLRQYHCRQRLYVLDLLDEGKSYLKSIVDMFEEKFGPQVSSEVSFKWPHSDEKPDDNACGDMQESSDVVGASEGDSSIWPNVVEEVDASEFLSQVLQEKEEARYFLERNVNDTLQKEFNELQSSLLQATNEKVKALMELAHMKQEYQLLQDKINHESRQRKLPPCHGEKKLTAQEKEGKFKSLVKNNLKCLIGSQEFEVGEADSWSSSEGNFTPRGASCSSIDVARMKIENATLRESMESMEHLTSVVRKLRLSLQKAKATSTFEGTISPKILDEIIREAKLVKTALGSSLPLSWSMEGDVATTGDGITKLRSDSEDFTAEKVGSVSAAGFEMVELLILAAKVMKDKALRREVRDGS